MNSIITQDTLDQLTDSVELAPGGPVAVLNIPAGQWHTARALESGTMIMEMKDGKYGPRACEEMNPAAQ